LFFSWLGKVYGANVGTDDKWHGAEVSPGAVAVLNAAKVPIVPDVEASWYNLAIVGDPGAAA
jgi:hypothetical protein